MASKYLDGSMVPRAVVRRVDHRSEPRSELSGKPAVIEFRGRRHDIRLANVSQSGAMLIFRLIPIIGETIKLRLDERGEVDCRVCWVRDGKVGVTLSDRSNRRAWR